MNIKYLSFLLLFALAACGGSTTAPPNVEPNPSLPSGVGAGWKMAWGDGQKSTRVVDPVTLKVISETTWNVSAVFQALLAEQVTNSIVIDEGPNKGQVTNLRWKGTDIPYDNRYHPLTRAICKVSSGGWAGFGSTGSYAVYQDESGIGRIYEGHAIYQIGMNVVSQSTVPSVNAPALCGSNPVWYTVYYDRANVGPGTIVQYNGQ
ncbi:hypothetical protein RF679_02085 [Undibacterium cyanobacteriorum]|uniref:Uncharacterized protein n=1 Tax=Undibacterium cyanobacteriorum TaxID=3073561 RepID=A0ABY9RIN9_9BURK|nr:hypothetical protein [Undibacterium sp. 20NA77.5]WMW81083.1 hypothetical protein RF679_02085 [Undibacterium sp. 20NA77.5]